MVGSLVLVIRLLAGLVFQAVPVNVSVDMDIPREVVAGSAFEVTITINKGNLEGFSRFQQEYPGGLTAVSVNSANADFTFSENRVRFIWLRLPRREEITITYRVAVDERLKGTFTLGGQFSYVEDEETRVFDAEPVNITILPSASINPELIVDVKDFEKIAEPEVRTAEEIRAVTACIRGKPIPGANGEYTVNLLVTKDKSSRFAKIEENIPSGYSAKVRDAQSGTFTFSGQVAKFVWMVMPMGDHFIASYTLVPSGRNGIPAPQPEGTFTFLLGTETVSKGIPERDIDLASLETYEIEQLVQETAPEQARVPIAGTKTATVAVAPAASPGASSGTPVAAVPSPAETAVPTAQVSSSQPSSSSATGTASGTMSPPATDKSLEPAEGTVITPTAADVSFRVQVAAGRLPIDVASYFGNLKLEGAVQQETENGLTRYTVGSFDNYQQAKDYKDQILKMTAIKDAFVVAYRNGNRITIQEALAATQ